MKTFNDLTFKEHPIVKTGHNTEAKYATLEFENGYGVSVIFGRCFYSNGVDSYELGVTYCGELTYDTDITNDVIGYISSDKVTEIMQQVQKL